MTPGKNPAKNVPPNSVKNIRPYTLSRENSIFATSITPSEKSSYSYKLISQADFSKGASSGRQFFGFDPCFSFVISLFENLSKIRRSISHRLLCVFISILQGLGSGVLIKHVVQNLWVFLSYKSDQIYDVISQKNADVIAKVIQRNQFRYGTIVKSRDFQFHIL